MTFDLLRLSGTDATGWPYQRRRAVLDYVFAARRLCAPWTLCPSTTDPATVREWLSRGSVGMEGVVFKRLNDPYQPSVRGLSQGAGTLSVAAGTLRSWVSIW
ncbi:ATP-dependent DNA ligase [Streptomyces sp. NPDC004561]